MELLYALYAAAGRLKKAGDWIDQLLRTAEGEDPRPKPATEGSLAVMGIRVRKAPPPTPKEVPQTKEE